MENVGERKKLNGRDGNDVIEPRKTENVIYGKGYTAAKRKNISEITKVELEIKN